MCVKQLVLLCCVFLTMSVKGQSTRKYQASAEGDDGFSQSGISFAVSANGTTEACVGGSAEFSVLVKGAEAYRYTWKKLENASFSQEGKSVLKLNNLTEASAGNYYCIVSDVNGKVTLRSDTVTLKVYKTPDVRLSVEDNKTRIAYGDSVRLVASGNAAEYQWNIPLPAEGGWVHPQTTMTYMITGKNGNICAVSKSVEIEVVPLYVNPGPGKQIAVGQKSVLTVETNADTVFWYAKPLTPAVSRSRMAAPATHPQWGTLVGKGNNCIVAPTTSTLYTAVGYVNTFSALATVSVLVKGNETYRGGEDDGFTQASIPFGITPLADTIAVCEKGDMVLTVLAKGVSVYDYTWYKVPNHKVIDSCSLTLKDCNFATSGNYYCKITDRLNNFSLYSDTVYVKVNELPRVKIQYPAADTTICGGDTVQLIAGLSPSPTYLNSADVRFQWSGNSVAGAGNTAVAYAAPLTKSSYIVAAESEGCQTLDTVTVDVNIPYVDLPATTVVSEHGSIDLFAYDINGLPINPAMTTLFQWGINNSVVTGGSPATNPYTIPDVDTTIHRAWVTVRFGNCEASDTTYFKMKVGTSFYGGIDDGFARSDVLFGITPLADTTLVCQGDSVTLNVTAKGVSLYQYTWYKVNSPQDDSLVTQSFCTLKNCDFPTQGHYYCKVTDLQTGFSLNSDTTYVQVNERPRVKILKPLVDTLICIGDTIYLMAGLDPEPTHIAASDVQFSWQGNQVVWGQNGKNCRVAPTVGTDYIVTADYKGCQTVDTVRVNVNVPYVDLPATMIVSEHSNVNIQASDKTGQAIVVSNTSEFIWGVNSSIVQSSYGGSPINNPLTIWNIDTTVQKAWVAVKFGNCWASDTTYFKLKVGTSFLGGIDDGFTSSCIEPTILESYGQEKLVCQNNHAVTVADSVVLRVVYEGSDVEIQWEKYNPAISAYEQISDGGGIAGTHKPVLKFKPLDIKHNGTYRCVLQNACSGKIVCDTFTVSVKGEPVIVSSTNNDRIRCRTDEGYFKYNVIAEGATPEERLRYQWYKDGVILVNDTNNYLIRSLLESDNTVNGQYVSPAGLYVLEVSNDCGSVYDSARLIVNEPATIVKEMEDPVYACEGEKKEFSVQVSGGGNYEYELLLVDVGCNNVNQIGSHIIASWPGYAKIKIPVTTSGKYIWRVRNDCSKGKWTYSSFMTVQMDKKPSFVSVPGNQDICVGETLDLECVAAANNRNLFYWEKDNVLLPGQTTNRLVIANVTAADAGVYRCYVYNECNPVASDAIIVKVGDKPQLVSISNIERDYCQGDTVQIKANVSTAWPLDSLRWYYKGQPLYDDAGGHITGADHSLLTIQGVDSADATGGYTVKLMNSCGASWSLPVSFELKKPARFKRGLDNEVDLILCLGTSHTLYVEAVGTPQLHFIWTHDGDTIADGNSNYLPITNAQVDTAGEYVCHVQNGCGDDITKTLIQVSRADTFRFNGGGHYCEGSNGLSAILAGSDTSTLYRLYREGSSTPIREIHGKNVVPQRGYIEFKNLTAGTYYVTGTNRNNCEDRMPGTVVILEDPLPFDFGLFVKRHMCEGETTGDLALPGSQTGVEYYLLKNKVVGWDTVQPPYAGTGNPLLMTVGAGFYKVYAVDTATGCGRSLSGLDSITPRPYPQECELSVLNGDSVYCRNSQSDVTLTYDCFESGSSYTLWKNGQLMNPPKYTAPLQWPGTEEGIYNIRVMNKWGCVKDFGHQEVIIQELPRQFHLTGARIYCPDEPGNHMLDLEDSDPGVEYSFRYLPNTLVKDTVSLGGEIKIQVPLQERKYYVVATDTTPEHCSITMLDTVDVRMSRLQVVPTPPVVYVEYNQSVQLNIVIQNAEGIPVITWSDPNHHLADPLNTQNPNTKPFVWPSENFLVSVTDASGCNVETSVRVIRIGGELKGEIRFDCDSVRTKDTVVVCQGTDLELCAYAEGGKGDYVYKWSDLNNPDLVGNNGNLTYIPAMNGHVWLDITSGKQHVRDSVYVIVGDSPRVDTLEPPYSRCVTPGSSEEIVLKNSQSGVSYSLEYSPDGLTYNYVDLTPTYGSDGRITFSLLDASDFQGYVRIVGKKLSSYGEVKCPAVMYQEVEIRVAPTRYDVLGGWNYCGTELVKDTILVNGAQTGVTYHLKRLPSQEMVNKTAVAGEDSVLFIGMYGAGDYIVTAEIGACRDTMNGTVHITADTLPPIGDLIGKGNHCLSDCPVAIGITNGLPGIQYYLILDTLGGGTSTTLLPSVPAAGSVLFGTYCQLGTYSVKAVNPVTSCEDKKASVVIRETPDIKELTGDTVYCESDYGVEFSMPSTETGATYYIQKWNTDSMKWLDMVPPVTIAGNGNPFAISRTFTGGEYRLMSSAPCPAAMDTVSVRMIPLPVDTLKLELDGNACIDSAFTIKIDPREPGVTYTLRYNGIALLQSPVLTATGIEWHFTSGLAGNYSVWAEREGCGTMMKDSVSVDSVPGIYPLDGVKQLCRNDKGELYLNGYETGVKYQLYDTAAHSYTVTGVLQHDSIVFKEVKPGTYYVSASRGSCKIDGELYTIKALPAPQPVHMEMADCVESGKGWLKLTGLQDSLEYLFTGNTSLGPVRNFTGDTLFENLSLGIYCVTARDTVIGCESVSVCDTIREGVGHDSLVGDFFYCEGDGGATLTLSGTSVGVEYSILKKDGTPLMTISRPVKVFPNTVEADTFIFRKKRPGYLAGCQTDSLFEVKKVPLPNDSLEVELTGGSVLCAGGNYYVRIHQSEGGKRYILQKKGSTVGLDTVYGDAGQSVTFGKPLTQAGQYKIWVSDTLYNCPVYLDTVITVSEVPEPVVVDSCYYCYDYGSLQNSDSCQIGIRGMLTGMIYRLSDGTELDTLKGPGNGVFRKLPSGDYRIIAEDQKSGCIDTMETSIRAVSRPQILDVYTTCGEQGVLDTIHTFQISEVAADSVVYYVYKNGIRQPLSWVGDGIHQVGFGGLTEAGTYKIYAEKKSSKCGVFMRDSIVITPPLTCQASDTLKISGSFCKGSGGGVTVSYGCSVSGWNYYLRGVVSSSDTIAGGNTLIWNQIDGHPLWDGDYILKAYNQCGNVVNLDTVKVSGKPGPQIYPIVNKNISLCEGNTFDIVLSGSEEGVIYTVVNSGIEKARKVGIAGGGQINLGTFSAPGYYKVWGEKDGCKVLMDELIVEPAVLPQLLQVLGMDKCQTGIQDSMEICLPKREGNVRYYLYVNGTTLLDSLTTVAPGKLCFDKQTVAGRYTVIAEHPASKCRREMKGVFFLSEPPVAMDMDNPGAVIHICQGTDTCLYMENSQVGISYILTRDGVALGTPAYTNTGGPLQVGCVNMSGTYRVIGKVGECETAMSDSVIVSVHNLPQLNLKNEVHYCEFSGGAEVVVGTPTDSTVRYDLYTPNGVSPWDVVYGKSDKTAVSFIQWADSSGYYKVVATDTTTECSRSGFVHVIEDRLPIDYDLISSTGNYICADGNGTCTYMSLSGSQSGVEYTLYRLSPNEDKATKEGTGAAFRFPGQICDTGVYMVRAVNLSSGCENRFSPVHIGRSDTVRRYKLTSVANHYCSLDDTSPKGIIQLNGSQVGVEYEVYRDGAPLGLVQMGTGGVLTWTGLEGKLCRTLGYPPRGGYVYAIVGRDTLTNCTKQMEGLDTIVAEEKIEILAQEPNEDLAACEMDSVQFSVTASGCGLKYQWYHNGAPLLNETREYYNITSLNPMTDPGFYYCKVSNTCGVKETQLIELKINPLVKVKEKMEPIVICNPKQKNIVLASSFENAQYYVWYRVDETEADWLSLTSTYEIEQFDTTKVGKYVCKASNRCNVVYDTCEIILGTAPQVHIQLGRDTVLCGGTDTYYEMEVIPGPGVTIEWEFNGHLTGVTGNIFPISPVTSAREGLYAVRAKNACGSVPVNVGTVWVDDTIKVIDRNDSIMLRCPEEYETLFLTTQPSKRVTYHWVQSSSPDIVSYESSFRVGPMGTHSPLNYRVYYNNRCSAGQEDYVIHVPRKIETDPLPKMIALCADCATDTVLRLNVDGSMFAEFKWYYRVNELDTVRTYLEHERGDSLPIRLCTENTGYYYCKVYNRCESDFTTETSWVRIDTVPVIHTVLLDDTVCEGFPYTDTLTATGGGLTYTWEIVKKNGEKNIITTVNQAYLSTSVLNLTDITMDYDSCRIRCYTHNLCGSDTSNTMLLRVLPKMEVDLTPSEQTICIGDSALLKLELLTGRLPWEYKLEYPDHSVRTVSHITGMRDSVYVNQVGTYKLVAVNDTAGCMRTYSLPVAEVKSYPRPELTFSGSQTVCEFDTAGVRFQVTGGTGPWAVQIVEMGGGIAMDICGTDSLVMYSRDTTVRFQVTGSKEYSVYSFRDLGTSCQGDFQDSTVKVTVNKLKRIRFWNLPWEVGQCRNVNLWDVLEPTFVDTTPIPSALGHFVVNGVNKGSSGTILQHELKGNTKIDVYFEYVDSAGCTVKSDEVGVWIDTLPYGRIVSADYSCPGQGIDFDLRVGPKGSADSVILRTIRYKKGSGTGINTTTSYPASAWTNDTLLQVHWSWSDAGGVDSCIVIQVRNIYDKHGCNMSTSPAAMYDSVYVDTIWRHVLPEVSYQVRRRPDLAWETVLPPVSLVSGDSLQVKVSLDKGMPLWSLPNQGIDTIWGLDTTFWLKKDTTHVFKALDLSCGIQGLNPPELQLVYLDTGYFKGRIWLEGPFDGGDMEMKRMVHADSLHLPQASSLPLLPAGEQVVDWIEVELRIPKQSGSSLPAPVDSVAVMSDTSFFVTRDSCLVLSHGWLADRWTGDTAKVGIRNACKNNVDYRYVVLRHRNHLGVMTRDRYGLVKQSNLGQIPYIDFTASATIYTRDGTLSNHMTFISKSGFSAWLLSAGLINRNEVVTLQDPNRVTIDHLSPIVNPASLYDVLYDVNLDGQVDWPGWENAGTADWDIVKRNRTKFTEIKWKK